MSAIDLQAALDRDGLDELRSSFTGELVQPDDPTYDQQRKVWNGSIDRHPALVAQCASPADVVSALRFARGSDLPLAVRGGGHSFPGHSVCDGGLVVDLGAMRGISVDPDGRTVTAQAGVLLGDLDAATQRFGMAVPAGIVTHTGIAGLTLGGGIGWQLRKYGLTIDQLLSVELVTASGELLRASQTENSDHFWGIRGGGGNFGIVTEFTFRLNPLGPTVLAGPIFWPMSDSPKLLRFYRDWIADAPDDLMTIVIHRRAPAVPFMPRELHGEPVVAVACCYTGSLEEGERILAPLRRWGRPILDLCEPKPFVEHQAMFDPSFPHGRWYYMRACDVGELSDEVIDTTVEHSMRIRSPLTSFPIWQMGGAMARRPESEMAFNGRHAGYTFNVAGCTASADGFDEEREWVRALWAALEPHHLGTVYVNFLMAEGEERVRQAYGAERYDRLKALKRTYDPENLFRLNQNISPN